MLAATGARAQDLQAPDSQQRPPDTRPATASLPREQLDRIYNIRQLEVLLTNAVKAGANSLAARMQVTEPNSLFVTSNAHSRGTELEGYGIFFYVDVPTMLQSVVWSAQVRNEQVQDYYRARGMANDPKLPDGIRRLAENQARSLAKVLGLQATPPPALADAQQVPAPGTIVAATADNVIPAASGRGGAPPPAPPAAAEAVAPVAPILDPRSPNELYTEAIKEKLIDAMLSYGSALRLDDKEWLVIAARAVNDSTPGQLDDSASILIRIKGEDLNAYMMRKLTREEVIKKIEVKEG
jgi:hypothetical protein